MPPKYFGPKGPLSSSLQPIYLRPLARLFTPRSTSSNNTSSLSPGLTGGLAAIGVLALLCAAGAGLALHVHYCRQSSCSLCCAVDCFRWRRTHSVQVHGPDSPRQTDRDEYSQTPHDRVHPFGHLAQDSLISSPAPFPPLTPPPTVHIRGPQSPEMTTSNAAVSVRGSITPSVISDDYAHTLRASEFVHPYPSSRSSPTSLVGKVTPPERSLDGSPNPSVDVSTITLPSFVEEERLDTTSSPMLATPTLFAMTERTFPSLTRFSFQPSRSRSMIANTLQSSEMHLGFGHDLPSPSSSAPDRRPPFPRTRSSSPRRASVRRELATAKLKSAARAEAVRIVQPGTSETSEQPGTTSLRRDALSPLKIPARTLSFLGDYNPVPYRDSYPLSGGEWDAELVSNGPPRPTSLNPLPHDGTPPTPHINDPTGPSSLYPSPVLGSLNSASSYASLDEKRSRGTSQATSSMSTVPSISAFPSPPDFTPGTRDKTLSVLNDHSTCGQPFTLATLREKTSVGGTETASLNEGRASTCRLSDADAPRLMTTVNSSSVPSRHLHPEFTRSDLTSARSGISFASMKRLSRVPLGPRQMYGGSKLHSWWTSQPSI